jgi:hypothetical protein
MVFVVDQAEGTRVRSEHGCKKDKEYRSRMQPRNYWGGGLVEG